MCSGISLCCQIKLSVSLHLCHTESPRQQNNYPTTVCSIRSMLSHFCQLQLCLESCSKCMRPVIRLAAKIMINHPNNLFPLLNFTSSNPFLQKIIFFLEFGFNILLLITGWKVRLYWIQVSMRITLMSLTLNAIKPTLQPIRLQWSHAIWTSPGLNDQFLFFWPSGIHVIITFINNCSCLLVISY